MRKRSAQPQDRSSYPLLFIFTEGENTEPQYINAVIEDRLKIVEQTITKTKIRKNIRINEDKTGNDPQTLVENAVSIQRQLNADNCYFLCIFDNDMRIDTKGKDFDRIKKAFDIAKNHEVDIIFSNPSFEYWALLHFKDTSAPMDQTEAINQLKKYVKKYDRKLLDYSLMQLTEKSATERANKYRAYDKIPKKLDQVKENPNTNADIILEVIQKFIAEFTSI